MEVDERPTEQYSDIGGLDKQIQELIEAVVLPMTHRDKFETLGIQPPGVDCHPKVGGPTSCFVMTVSHTVIYDELLYYYNFT